MSAEVDYARINNTMGKMHEHLSRHKCICVSVSGGADSDVIVHISGRSYLEARQKQLIVGYVDGMDKISAQKKIK